MDALNALAKQLKSAIEDELKRRGCADHEFVVIVSAPCKEPPQPISYSANVSPAEVALMAIDLSEQVYPESFAPAPASPSVCEESKDADTPIAVGGD